MAKKEIPAYIEHLSKDKKLLPIINELGELAPKKRKNVCLRLCASIMSQQLSTRVAEVLFKRFLELYGGEEPTPQQIADMPFDTLRAIGLSNAKVSYVQNVAKFIIEHQLDDKQLAKMSNDELIETLTQIKGVGRWTVEMLLMFSLGREDVFAVDDLGIQQAMIKLYKINPENKREMKEKMLRQSQKWAPYRTHACMYLWRHKDATQ